MKSFVKKYALCLALVMALFIVAAPSAAFADELINLGTTVTGSALDIHIKSVPGDNTVTYDSAAIPLGCRIETEKQDDGQLHIYLRGTPTQAGSFSFALDLTAPAEYSGEVEEGEEQQVATVTNTVVCSLTVNAIAPSVSAGSAINCYTGDEVSASVSASVQDGGTLSYQWYSSKSDSNNGGTLIADAVDSTLRVPTQTVGIMFYYCVVTNNNNGMSTSTASPTIQVTVQELTVSSITIASMPTKTEYTVGDKLDASGLTVSVSYSNGSSQILSDLSALGLFPNSLATVGQQEITVSYRGQNAKFTVTVKNKADAVDKIEVYTMPAKTRYEKGDRLDTSGMVLRAYNGDEHTDVTSGFGCSPMYLDKTGTVNITVTYKEKTCTFSVYVEEKETVRSISVAQMPDKTSYTIGEKLDMSGMRINVVTNKNSSTVDSGFTCTPMTLTQVGTQTITVDYQGVTTTFTISVKEVVHETPKPSATPAPSAAVTPSPTTQIHDNSGRGSNTNERGSVNFLVRGVIIVAALALVSLVIYLSVTKLSTSKKFEELLIKLGLLEPKRKKSRPTPPEEEAGETESAQEDAAQSENKDEESGSDKFYY